MSLTKEMRLLQNKWKSGQSWPKRLEWIEISNLRGWTGQRITFDFPIVAIVGENGVGKSTVLQAIASSFANGDYASNFFPDTMWESVRSATIRVSVREGLNTTSVITSVRKPTDRWRGNPDRRKRPVVYIDLRRIQPIAARYGYARLAKPQLTETSSDVFDAERLRRLSNVMGRNYGQAKLSTTSIDGNRAVPVLQKDGAPYSGFHQGAGETTITELLKQPIPKYAIVLIDEIETSLHPLAQRRLIRDISDIARGQEAQIVLTTHSPCILEELPPEGRVYIMGGVNGKQIITGVSPEFAMSKMDEDLHPEADIFVEDEYASTMLREILVVVEQDLVSRVQMIPFGAANVGRSLGQMVKENRFPRPTAIFLDGDQEQSDGCYILPGGDAPERVVFTCLQQNNWNGVYVRIGRGVAETIDACNSAMTLIDHHEWVNSAADKLLIGGVILWQALCAQWVTDCLDKVSDGRKIADGIADCLGGTAKMKAPQLTTLQAATQVTISNQVPIPKATVKTDLGQKQLL